MKLGDSEVGVGKGGVGGGVNMNTNTLHESLKKVNKY